MTVSSPLFSVHTIFPYAIPILYILIEWLRGDDIMTGMKGSFDDRSMAEGSEIPFLV